MRKRPGERAARDSAIVPPLSDPRGSGCTRRELRAPAGLGAGSAFTGRYGVGVAERERELRACHRSIRGRRGQVWPVRSRRSGFRSAGA